MRTCIDRSRSSRNGDRRLPAADLEMSGRFVQLVPAIARKLAPRAATTDWARCCFSQSVVARPAENGRIVA